MEWGFWMNEKGPNFCSSSVGLEPVTPAHETAPQSIMPPRTSPTEREQKLVRFSSLHNLSPPSLWYWVFLNKNQLNMKVFIWVTPLFTEEKKSIAPRKNRLNYIEKKVNTTESKALEPAQFYPSSGQYKNELQAQLKAETCYILDLKQLTPKPKVELRNFLLALWTTSVACHGTVTTENAFWQHIAFN